MGEAYPARDRAPVPGAGHLVLDERTEAVQAVGEFLR